MHLKFTGHTISAEILRRGGTCAWHVVAKPAVLTRITAIFHNFKSKREELEQTTTKKLPIHLMREDDVIREGTS
jgi:hypothetical protein